MTIPKLSNINNYYNKVKQLISVNDEKREKLKTDISSYEKAIQNINSENLLDTVNGQIELLTKKV
jgi:septal ring factor EnvC (AmiA/AmiB activator)